MHLLKLTYATIFKRKEKYPQLFNYLPKRKKEKYGIKFIKFNFKKFLIKKYACKAYYFLYIIYTKVVKK